MGGAAPTGRHRLCRRRERDILDVAHPTQYLRSSRGATSRGTVAFAGSPLEIGPRDGHHRLVTSSGTGEQPIPTAPIARFASASLNPTGPSCRTVADAREPALTRQIWLMAARQARLFFAETAFYLLFLAALTVCIGGTDAADPGDSGLSQPGRTSRNPP